MKIAFFKNNKCDTLIPLKFRNLSRQNNSTTLRVSFQYSRIVYVPVCIYVFSSVQSLSRVQLFVTPMDCSMPGFPVHHQLLELAQTHVHQVGDAIQPSHPLLSPSPAFNLCLYI